MIDLLEKLKSFWSGRRAEVNSRFERTLPFGDYVVDRWEKAEALGFGSGTSIYDSAHVFGPVSVGSNTWIGPFTVLDGSGGLSIGDNCSISAGVQIYSHDTVDWAVSGGTADYVRKPTTIGNRCYIGPNSVVAMGVTIGDGAVVGANSFVNRDVASGARVAGNPARPIDRSAERQTGDAEGPSEVAPPNHIGSVSHDQ
ncbi:acyltransferase [Tsuneonella troitsensis]|uniref:acyltransferase n=1 Tax=Tsuneonella troitsensis TaxID=292222 RepID=UPI000B1A6CD1|nr:acyltransferase [Tsuneonella troitsensis]